MLSLCQPLTAGWRGVDEGVGEWVAGPPIGLPIVLQASPLCSSAQADGWFASLGGLQSGLRVAAHVLLGPRLHRRIGESSEGAYMNEYSDGDAFMNSIIVMNYIST